MTQQPPLVRTPFTKDKLLSEPWIPLAAVSAGGACVLGIRQFLLGDSRKSQTMMRMRILFQGLAIVGIGVSILKANYIKSNQV